MTVFKDTIKAYSHLLLGVLTVSRVMAFEKFSVIFFFFYVLSILSISLVLWLIHWTAGLVFFMIFLLLFSKVSPYAEFLKRLLIRKGDTIEYADPKADEKKDIFKKAEVIVKMRFSEVAKTKLISDELMQGNKHFYLVKVGKDVTVVAYDWIIGLSPEILEMDFDLK